MNDLELRGWTSFFYAVKNFLGNHQAENQWKSLPDICANMSIKVHFFTSHLDKFPDNCGNVSKEQKQKNKKQFPQDIKTMEERDQRRWDKRIMDDYCWSIKRDLNNIEQDR